MEHFEPELGNLLFGNAYGEYSVPEEIADMLYKLSEKLDPEMPAYGVEFENDVFAMFPYYWGDCTCGFEDEYDDFLEKYDHSEDCFHTKLEEFEQQLRTMDIKCYGETADAYRMLIEQFAAEYGLKGEYFGIQIYCTCGFHDLHMEWLKTHNHDPNCPVVRPNFYYKPSGLKIYWYKYIGRDMSSNRPVTLEEFSKIFKHCLDSLNQDQSTAKRDKEESKEETEDNEVL